MTDVFKLNGNPITHIVVLHLAFDGLTYILYRNNSGMYRKLATIHADETWDRIEAIAQVFTRGFPVPVVNLGILEGGKFTSEDAGEPFASEAFKISLAITAHK